MSPQEVAKMGYEAMINEELFVVPGGTNKAIVAGRRIMSVGLQAKLNEKMNEDVPQRDLKHPRGEKEQAAASNED
jgi:short-subunit dehydrogenase